MMMRALLCLGFLASVSGLRLQARNQIPGAEARPSDEFVISNLQITPEHYANFVREFPDYVLDLQELSLEVTDEGKEKRMISMLAQAFNEETMERKHAVYMAIRAHTPAFRNHNYTYSMEELQDDLEQTFLTRQLWAWMRQKPEMRAPIPPGLHSRGPEFVQMFQNRTSRCDFHGGGKEAIQILKKKEAPIYGKFCGVGETHETVCNGENMISGEEVCKDDNEGEFCCGQDVCKDDGLDELCCRHDHTYFDAKADDLLMGLNKLGAIRSQPCEVDRQFWEGLNSLPDELNFNDGGGLTSSDEQNSQMGAKCYLYVTPCLVKAGGSNPWDICKPASLFPPHPPVPCGIGDNSEGYKYKFKFGDYGEKSDCGSFPCYRENLDDEKKVVQPAVGLAGMFVSLEHAHLMKGAEDPFADLPTETVAEEEHEGMEIAPGPMIEH